jgi:hypothetical protein
MIIGIIGVKNSGKSTAASFLAKRLGARQLSFADKLKETCSNTFSIPLANFEDREVKEKLFEDRYILTSHLQKILDSFGILNDSLVIQHVGTKYNSYRELLQVVGTDILRSYDQNIHVNSVDYDPNGVSIITDVRFENEANILDSKKAHLLYIHNEKAESGVTEKSHESEKQVITRTRKYATYTIFNKPSDSGVSMQKFEQDLDTFIQDMMKYYQHK